MIHRLNRLGRNLMLNVGSNGHRYFRAHGKSSYSWLHTSTSRNNTAGTRCDCVDISKLDIDRDSPLKGTTAAYNTQVLISTGKSDWNSKIELENGLAAELKGILGRAGLKKGFEDLRHPDNVILTTNSSYPTSSLSSECTPHSSAYIFPQNIYIPAIPLSSLPASASDEALQFIRIYLLPTSPSAGSLVQASGLPCRPRKVHETHVLICTHNSRDSRCGMIGPMLHNLFTDYLSSKELLHPEDPDLSLRGKVRVGNISHIGGHKYAGNVIVYLPPDEDNWDQGGKGFWYGRVGGRADVEKIVNQTIVEGKIIEELFRGGVGI